MGQLTNRAAKTFKQGARRAYVPDWFLPVAYVVCGLGAAVVAVSAVIGSTGDPVAGEPAVVVRSSAETTVPTSGAPATTVEVTAGPSSTGPATTTGTQADEMVVIVDETGASISVPASALAVARAAAAAVYTGDYTNVVFSVGTRAAEGTETFPAPVVGEPRAAARFEDGSWRFSFNVDPDGTGAQPARRTGITVERTGSGWGYVGVPAP